MRLVWDCRASTRHFKAPPRVELGAAEATQRLDVDTHDTLCVAQADVVNCFYQCSIPTWLCDFFALEAITEDEAVEIGLPHFVNGISIAGHNIIHPCLVVLPM